MKPWRDIATPHRDVLEGTIQQATFAADITAVHNGEGPDEYKDAKAFYERTFITGGMKQLLKEVVYRLNGNGGEPIIQLQTNFGGGKTHTMLAVYHLASRDCPIHDLEGIPSMLDEFQVTDVPKAKVVVLDGTNLSPTDPRSYNGTVVNTILGEIAWQLGGPAAYNQIKDSDENGTAPRQDTIKKILEENAPCVILVDELVAYARQFSQGEKYKGGTWDTMLSMFQVLTQAVARVPTAVLLTSLPQSKSEVGDSHAQSSLERIEKAIRDVVTRKDAKWKPIEKTEGFEIVRRRLFEPISATADRDEVCNAFYSMYQNAGAKVPAFTHDFEYRERLEHAYPIHPEIFDRLYEDWSSLDGFQKTRGVLKLMARVIHRLWSDGNKDKMIMPSSVPLEDGNTRAELTTYLGSGWEQVIDRDIDGDSSASKRIDNNNPRFGALQAAVRVSRTLFLGSAPLSVEIRKTSQQNQSKGLTKSQIILGCVQPTESESVYVDTLSHLVDKLHYISASGDKNSDNTTFWFGTAANLRREMEERKPRFNQGHDVFPEAKQHLSKTLTGSQLFQGIHTFVQHQDLPDDTSLRLVVLPPTIHHSRTESDYMQRQVELYLQQRGGQPRYHKNRLLFLVADTPSVSRMEDSIRTYLAWQSIGEDIRNHRLNVTVLQQQQAEDEKIRAKAVMEKATVDCYKWLVCPVQEDPMDNDIDLDTRSVQAQGRSLMQSIDQVCLDEEFVITAWSPILLRNKLNEIYFKTSDIVKAIDFWNDSTKFLYIPRLKDRSVLQTTIQAASRTPDFFGYALGQTGDRFEGFTFTGIHQLDNQLILIKKDAADAYQRKLDEEEAAKRAAIVEPVSSPVEGGATSGVQGLPQGTNIGTDFGGTGGVSTTGGGTSGGVQTGGTQPGSVVTGTVTEKLFIGSVAIDPAMAKMQMVQLCEEIIQNLTSDPSANIEITVEIRAEFAKGVTPQTKRAIDENIPNLPLTFKVNEWE